ncbi:2Fe-2S iron-sulfur cluster-binding protein [Syntrophomonas erecta]
MVLVTIDGHQVEAEKGQTILEVCHREKIHIPTLCYHEAFGGQGACRMCMVEIRNPGRPGSRLVAACTYPIMGEVEVFTRSEQVLKVRRTLAQLIARRIPDANIRKKLFPDETGELLLPVEVQPEGCMLCRLCILACENMGRTAIWTMFRGTEKRVGTPYDEDSDECIGCAACAQICPTGAIKVIENENSRVIWNREFKLVSCQRCGRGFATEEQLKLVTEQVGGQDSYLCEDCRKKVLASAMQVFHG